MYHDFLVQQVSVLDFVEPEMNFIISKIDFITSIRSFDTLAVRRTPVAIKNCRKYVSLICNLNFH